MWSYLRRFRPTVWAFPLLALLVLVVIAIQGGSSIVTFTVLSAAGVPVQNANVTVVGTTLGSITNLLGRGALKGVSPGAQIIRVRFLGCPVADKSVDVPSGGGTVDVTITLGCKDVVKAQNGLTSPLIGLLDLGSNASGPSTCVNDVILLGTGSLTAPGNATLTDVDGTACHTAALLLTNDRAPLYVNDPAAIAWTPALGNEYLATLPATKLRVPIRFYISDAALTSAQRSLLTTGIKDVELFKAQKVLNESYAGIELADNEAGGAPQVLNRPAAQSLLDGGCLKAKEIRADATIYDAGHINVYYTRSVKNELGYAAAGYACGTSDAPDMIFIDHNQHFPYTLVHELGHALGLTRPFWGHPDYFEGFYTSSGTGAREQNAMAEDTKDYDSVYLPGEARYFSVGQVAWMHLSADSWLNRPSAGDGSTTRARQAGGGTPITTSCGCPATESTPDCPALKTDIDRTGTKRGPVEFAMACRVVPVATTLIVCLDSGAPATLDAHYFDFTGTLAGWMWVSQDPSIVTTTNGSGSDNYMPGEFRGVSAGTATVRAYADGSYETITVTVKTACP